jgi:hypothetical protein
MNEGECSCTLFTNVLGLLVSIHGNRLCPGEFMESLPGKLGAIEREYCAGTPAKRTRKSPGALCWYLTPRGNVVLRKPGNEPPGAERYQTKRAAREAWESKYRK